MNQNKTNNKKQNTSNSDKIMALVCDLVRLIGAFAVLIVAIATLPSLLKAAVNAAVGEHQEVVTNTIVEQKLSEIGELACYEEYYKSVLNIKDARQLFGISLGFTKHTIDVNFECKVKLGCKVDGIRTNVRGNQIEVTIPEIEILDFSYNILDITENNNILNPISSKEIEKRLDNMEPYIRQLSLQPERVEAARSHIEDLIRNLLSVYEGYEIVFL